MNDWSKPPLNIGAIRTAGLVSLETEQKLSFRHRSSPLRKTVECQPFCPALHSEPLALRSPGTRGARRPAGQESEQSSGQGFSPGKTCRGDCALCHYRDKSGSFQGTFYFRLSSSVCRVACHHVYVILTVFLMTH